MKEILITICGRGGSKGIPGKNVKEVGGLPLIAYSIRIAKKVAEKYNADLILSTDSEEIKRVAALYGLETPYTRPAYLADDHCGKPEAIRDVMLYAEKAYGKRYDYVLDLDVTSPIRTVKDVEGCMALIEEHPDALTVFSVNPCARNPYFSMVEEKQDGYYREVVGGVYKTRQSSPKVYDMNGSIYVYRRESLDRENPKAVTPRSLVYVMDHICFDLDEPQDYDYLAWLIDTKRVTIE